MTKEMRPAHRIDILTHAHLCYGCRTKQNHVRSQPVLFVSLNFFVLFALQHHFLLIGGRRLAKLILLPKRH